MRQLGLGTLSEIGGGYVLAWLLKRVCFFVFQRPNNATGQVQIHFYCIQIQLNSLQVVEKKHTLNYYINPIKYVVWYKVFMKYAG